LTIVGPWGRAVIPVIIGNEAVVLGNGLSLRFPEPDVREGAMHEDDRSACPLFDVGQLHAVDTQLARRRWGFRARLQDEATTHRGGGEPPDEFLRQFPSGRRDQPIAALDLARATLLASARSS